MEQMSASPNEEVLDLVDRADRVIGQMGRDEVLNRGLLNFRVVNGFVRNSSGALFIPRRAPTKRLFPDSLDVSVGGHVSAGETYAVSLMREAEEELGIRDKRWLEIGAFAPHSHGVSAFMRVYLLEAEETPPYNREDFSEAYWLQPVEILRRITMGDRAKGDLANLVRLCFLAGSY